jgi:hypothetical protein
VHQGSTAAVLVAFLLGGLVATVSDGVSFVAAMTVTGAGITRYLAVLRGASKEEIERATAKGFLSGLVLSCLTLAIAALV